MLFYQPLAKEGTNIDSGPRLSEGSRADFATWLLSDVHGRKSIGQPRLERGCWTGWACGQQQLPWPNFHPKGEKFAELLGEALR